jgi:predicted amidohydrolase
MGLHPEDEPRAIDEAEEGVRSAARQGARLICLPEHWLVSKVLKPDDGVHGRFSGLARELGVAINLGGIYERDDEGTYFVSTTISRSGEAVSRQRKVHLYRGEKRKAKPGSSFDAFRVEGTRVGVMVCHDVVFPESARTLALDGAELLIVPSLIVSEGLEPWHVYLKARALENRVPVVSTNAYAPPQFLGRSAVIGLEYDWKERVMRLKESVAPGAKTVLVETVDLDSLEALREERLAERRPDAYRSRERKQI